MLKCHYQLQYYLYQILNTAFPYSNQSMLSGSLGYSGKLRSKLFTILAFGALLRSRLKKEPEQK